MVCSQEVMYAEANNVKYGDLKKRLKSVCENPLTVKVLKSYPLRKLPLKQMIFAYAMKYKLYFVLKKLVDLRSR